MVVPSAKVCGLGEIFKQAESAGEIDGQAAHPTTVVSYG